MGPTCDLWRNAATARVGAGFKTSDKVVNAKGIILVVVNSEQGVVLIVVFALVKGAVGMAAPITRLASLLSCDMTSGRKGSNLSTAPSNTLPG